MLPLLASSKFIAADCYEDRIAVLARGEGGASLPTILCNSRERQLVVDVAFVSDPSKCPRSLWRCGRGSDGGAKGMGGGRGYKD